MTQEQQRIYELEQANTAWQNWHQQHVAQQRPPQYPTTAKPKTKSKAKSKAMGLTKWHQFLIVFGIALIIWAIHEVRVIAHDLTTETPTAIRRVGTK